MQLIGYGIISSLGTLQLTLGGPSTSEIKDTSSVTGPRNKMNQNKVSLFI